MRGGRSSYEGCSPHGRTKPNSTPIIRAKEDAGRRRVLQISPVSQQQRASTSRDASSIEVSQAETVISTGSSEQVVTVVNVNPEPEPEEAHNTRLDVSAGMVCCRFLLYTLTITFYEYLYRVILFVPRPEQDVQKENTKRELLMDL